MVRNFSMPYNAALWKYKRSCFNGGVNVPLIVRYPKVVKNQGSFNRSAAHVIDILPTLLDLTATEPLTRSTGLAAAFKTNSKHIGARWKVRIGRSSFRMND